MDLSRGACDPWGPLVAGGEHIWSRELVLVTGKGGVGKTTVAASLARAAHAAGKRVLIAEVTSDVSTRSQLLGIFGQPAPKEGDPVRLEPNLWGVRITPSQGHRLFLRAALRVGMFVDAAMRSAALNRFLMAAPAFPEIGTLYHLVSLLRLRQFDHIILDLPATGHAIGLVSLPRTVLKVVPAGLIGDAIREGLEVMTDPARAGAVIVTLPESLPVTEAMELAESFGKLSIPVRSMILNRMPANPFSAEELAAVDGHIRTRGADLLLGARELRRLQRALAAQRDFWAQAPAAALRVEVAVTEAQEQGRVVAHVREALASAEGGK